MSILLLTMFFGKIVGVNAEEYYVNSNGVKLTEKEYDSISEFYWKGYQDSMTLKDYEYLSENGLFNSQITSVESNDKSSGGISLFAEHTTRAKSLKMSKACTTNCFISVSLTWLSLPTIRSYDLIGEYFYNTTVLSRGNVQLFDGSNRTTYAPDKSNSTSLGTTVKLPTTASKIKITHTFTAEKKGGVNASYQHAKKNISLSNSKKYSFSQSGIGGVFKFDTGIQDYYDCMAGVSLSLT